MSVHHAVVWLDHHHARVLFLHAVGATFDAVEVLAEVHERSDQQWIAHDRHAAGRRGVPDGHYFDAIEKAVGDALEVLVVGPSDARTQFVHHLTEHKRPLAARVMANEAMDHPSDGQLAHHAREFFERAAVAASDAPSGG